MVIMCKNCNAAFGAAAFEKVAVKREENTIEIYRPICPHCFAPQKGDTP